MSIQGCQSPFSPCSSQRPVMTLPSSLNLPVNLVVLLCILQVRPSLSSVRLASYAVSPSVPKDCDA
jgi:hypothetical protein